MGSLDAYKDEILSQLLDGDWKKLFPAKIYEPLEEWLVRHADKAVITVRFTFYHPQRDVYAVYLVCDPKVKQGKVAVNDLKFSDESIPLAIPPAIYDMPLYIMPKDLLQKILKKKRYS